MFCPRVDEKDLQAIAKDVMAVHDTASGFTEQSSSSSSTDAVTGSKSDKPVSKSTLTDR